MRTEKQITQKIQKEKQIRKNCIKDMLKAKNPNEFKIYQHQEQITNAKIKNLEWTLK